MVPTRTRIALTAPGAAELAVAVHQGRRARHCTEISCLPVNTDSIGPTEVGIRGNHLTHLLWVATVLLADGIKCGWSKDLVALSKQCREEDLAVGGAGDRALILGYRLACPPWLLHSPFLDEPFPVCGDCAIPQHEVIGPIFITDPTETIHL